MSSFESTNVLKMCSYSFNCVIDLMHMLKCLKNLQPVYFYYVLKITTHTMFDRIGLPIYMIIITKK